MGFARKAINFDNLRMEISAFQGLNTVEDPMRLGVQWLTVAENIDVTATGGLALRSGYGLAVAGAFTGLYGTLDNERMYAVDGGVLKYWDGTGFVVIKALQSTGAQVYWTEKNDQVYFSNGVDSGVILPDNKVIPWRIIPPVSPNVTPVTGTLPAGIYGVALTYTLNDGRSSGASDPVYVRLDGSQALQISSIPSMADAVTNIYIAPANSTVFQHAGVSTGPALVWSFGPDNLGHELQTGLLQSLPYGCEVVQEWRGRIYAAVYLADKNATAVWFSQPLGFHLFNHGADFIMFPGHVLMLASHDAGLIVGTESAIYAYDGTKIEALANYGVVPGAHWAQDNKRVLFWTVRGACTALPFSNLTERFVSVAPGSSACGSVVERGGQKRYLVSMRKAGNAFNSRQ